MTTAADIIELLLARKHGNLIVERKTGLPPGWGKWMRSQKGADSQLTISTVMACQLLQPDKNSRERTGAKLCMLQAFCQLWWQHWDPAPRDQRGLHWLAMLISLLIHGFFLLLLLWVAWVRWAADVAPGGEEGRMQVSFLRRDAVAAGLRGGTGSGAPDAVQDVVAEPVVAPWPARERGRQRESAVEATPVQAPSMAATPVAANTTPAAPQGSASLASLSPSVLVPAQQPLQSTPTPVATTEFVVPPPAPVGVAIGVLEAADVHVREREVTVVEPRPLMSIVDSPQVDIPEFPHAALSVPEHEVVAVVERPNVQASIAQQISVPELALPDSTVRELEVTQLTDANIELKRPRQSELDVALAVREVKVRTRELPVVDDAPQASDQLSADVHSPRDPVPMVSSSQARRDPVEVAGSGQVSTTEDWSAPLRSDDWSAADMAGQRHIEAHGQRAEGLFDRSGAVRVAEIDAKTEALRRGAPGSDADSWSRERIARSGSWLKRPPYGFTPTSLDRYWVPNESLLSEWVRKGIKNIEIPIPGTSTRISCVVSLLQFGGACGLSDPNMNEQPAQARPPPAIPFKKELQDGNAGGR